MRLWGAWQPMPAGTGHSPVEPTINSQISLSLTTLKELSTNSKIQTDAKSLERLKLV